MPPQVATPPVVAPAPQAKSDFEPIAPDEVEAFQKALQQAAAPKPATVQPPLRRPAGPAQEASDNNGFADTMTAVAAGLTAQRQNQPRKEG